MTMTKPSPLHEPGPPPRRLLMREAFGFLELPKLLAKWPSLQQAPQGNGALVVVLPGFGADDGSTWLLRRYLRGLGYKVQGWGLGRNQGNLRKNYANVMEWLKPLMDSHREKIYLVGWSLGGTLAREIAREHPDSIKFVLTMGSPVVGGPKYTFAARWYKRKGYNMDTLAARMDERNKEPIQVPVTALYSKRDGIVSWHACIDEHHEHITHIEVKTNHIGLGFSPIVYQIIATQLAQHTV